MSILYLSLKFGDESVSRLVDILGRRKERVQGFEQSLLEQSSGKMAVDGHVIKCCPHQNDTAAYGNKYRQIYELSCKSGNFFLSYYCSVFNASTLVLDATIRRKNRLGSLVLSFFVPYTNIYQRIWRFNNENSAPEKTAHPHSNVFRMKILICRKPAVIDIFNLLADKQHSVWEFCKFAFRYAGIELEFTDEEMEQKGVDQATGKVLVEACSDFYRPTDVVNLLGDPTKAKKKLCWNPTKTSFAQLVELMVKHDMEKAAAERQKKKYGEEF